MNEHPILFNGEMVRAILEGRKTQTRRVWRPQPNVPYRRAEVVPDSGKDGWALRWYGEGGHAYRWDADCPYGTPGDRLWVRETHGYPDAHTKGQSELWAEVYKAIWYRADDKYGSAMHHGPLRSLHWNHHWRPSIHMPRWASRISLKVTGVRVERVQDITEDDAMAEGVNGGCLNCGEPDPCGCNAPMPDHADSFAGLWNKINESRGFGWLENPWVWVVEFEREDT